MRGVATMIGIALMLSSCAGKSERLAKCSADDSQVPALGYGPEQPRPSAPAFDAALQHDCGPMRPVNQF